MNLVQSIMAARDISLEEAGVLIIMIQHASPNGGVHADESDLYSAYCKAFSKRPRKEQFSDLIQSLVDKGLIPTRTTVYPMDTSAALSEREAERLRNLLDEMTESREHVRPPQASEEQQRVFAALKAVGALDLAVRERSMPLTDGKGNPVVAGGERQFYKRKEWDYGLIRGLISDFKGVDHVLVTLFRLYATGALKDLDLDDKPFEERRTTLRKFVIGALHQGYGTRKGSSGGSSGGSYKGKKKAGAGAAAGAGAGAAGKASSDQTTYSDGYQRSKIQL